MQLVLPEEGEEGGNTWIRTLRETEICSLSMVIDSALLTGTI